MEIQRISLESLLDPLSDYYHSPDYNDISDDPAEVVIECMEIIEELSILEQNMITLETAKAVVKAKSASKKKKIIKSKMKAKDAKAKKKGGKVVRIKKVSKESDIAIDGGTGPIPTTYSTHGMTDTDLDAEPDTEVEVTETVDTPNGEEIVGTEGVDYIFEFEDTNITQMEADLIDNNKKFGEKIIEILKALSNFFISIWKKFLGLFQNLDKYLKSNREAIEKGLSSNKEISIKYKLISLDALLTFKKSLITSIIGFNDNLRSAALNPQRSVPSDNLLKVRADEQEKKVFSTIASSSGVTVLNDTNKKSIG
jgi:hypothetical protein